MLWATATELTDMLDNAARAGVGMLRFDIPWVQLEPTQGAYNWAPVWNVIKGARTRNIKLIGIITTLAPWVNNNAGWQYGPVNQTQIDQYALFCTAVAREFKGSFLAYELWNEPNLAAFWQPAPNAVDYAALLKQAYPAIKAIDSTVLVLSGGTGGAGGSATDIISTNFWSAVYDAGSGVYFDALCHHPYTNKNGTMDGEMAHTNDIRALMNAHGDSAKKIWGTETGAPTGGSGGGVMTENAQAQLVAATYAYWATLQNTGPLCWYTLYDKNDTDTTTEGFFGLRRIDKTDKPAYAAYAAVTQTGLSLSP